jgi:hypothetical protein
MSPLIYQCDHIGGDMNRLDVFQQSTFDTLFYPPCSIRTESYAAVGVEIIDGSYQTEISFFYQVTESYSPPGVFFCDVDYQSEIAANQLFSGQRVVFFSDKFTQGTFLLLCQQ